MIPLSVPTTSPKAYISFKPALNVRLSDEDTGDWHYEMFWCDVGQTDNPLEKNLAGEGQDTNSSVSLGDKGIRDLSAVIAMSHDVDGPVFVANHFRAVADLALKYMQNGASPVTLDNRSINDLFDTDEEIDELRTEYLLPLRKQLDSSGKKVFDRWIATVQFD